jgi:TolB-like protein/Tfp pilus assembly protein PilF
MSSLIPGYEYDIFISYRQKDNKGDRWVSEFVDALKTELESTFKEEISVYFDINPHDGLLVTHDVDESLKDKLRCLIFIPIISRTYCDPKSFAWEHEFKAFVELASKDQLGLKVKLPNGNVTSRILPVQIHDLYPEDKVLVEKELGGYLRAIEFIYKEPGVNKPLTALDNEKSYRIQINKVANAIDEIIHGIKSQASIETTKTQSGFKTEIPESETKAGNGSDRSTIGIRKSWLLIGAATIIIIAGLFFVFKILGDRKQDKDIAGIEKSIAVLPFKLLSDEPDKQYLADGMMDAITLHLSKIKNLRVMSRTSVEQYRVSIKTTRQIGKELDVEYLLEGSFQKIGDYVKLIVQLINANEESHEWANEYNGKWSDVFSLQSEIAQKVAGELKVFISPEEKQLIENKPTTSIKAYDLYQRGNEEQWKLWDKFDIGTLQKAEDFYKEALGYDPEFALAYTGLAWVYFKKHFWDEYFSGFFMDSVLILADKALSFDNQLSEAYLLRGAYYSTKGNVYTAIDEYDKAIKFNPNSWEAYHEKGWKYFVYNTDFVKGLECLHKTVSLNHGKELPILLNSLGGNYCWRIGFPVEAKYYLQEAFKLGGDTNYYYNELAAVERAQRNYRKSIELQKYCYGRDSNSVEILAWLAYDYYMLNQSKESLKYVKKFQDNLKAVNWVYYSAMKRIGYVYWQNGYKKEAYHWFNEQRKISEESLKMRRIYSIDANYDLATVYAFLGEKEKAYENLKEVAKIRVCPLWLLSAIKDEPLFNPIRSEQEFQKIISDLEAKYQAEHERVRRWLEERGML